MPKLIEIFRAGRHTAMTGDTIEFTAEDLAQSAKIYDPKRHEAPLVVGHPKSNAPAYGWVKRLAAAGSVLTAEPDQVDPAFAEMVTAGRFKKRSASFYKPDAPNNPVPGAYYLKHVGFLGAAAPAVKGLRDAEFADDDDRTITVEFADMAATETEEFAENKLSRLLNRLIDNSKGERAEIIRRMASAAGIDDGTVQQILRGDIERPPERRLRGFARVLNISVETLMKALPSAQFSEHEDETTMSEKKTEQIKDAEFAEREAAIARKEAEFAEREAAIAAKEAEARERELAEFADGLIKEGRLLPADKAGAVQFMAALDAGSTIEFGEGDDKKTPKALDWFQGFLKRIPKQVEFSELAPGGEAAADRSRSDSEIARRARAYHTRMRESGEAISFAEAVDAVTNDKDQE